MDCDAVCPSWDTSPGAIAFSLPQAPSTHIICHPIAEFAQQCHNLPPDHPPNLQATLFSSQKGSMSPSSPFRPSQGLSHLDGWKLQHTDGPGSPRAALCQHPRAVTAGCHPSEVSRSIQPPPWPAWGTGAGMGQVTQEQWNSTGAARLDVQWNANPALCLGGPVLSRMQQQQQE